jgi:hypothetical protein
MRRTAGLALAFGLAVASAATVLAQPRGPSPEFLAAFQAGTDAYRLGDYATARGHLERARALAPELPGPHRFLAAVDAAQGQWQACVDHARAAIAANPASSEIVATRKLHDDCRASLGRAPFTGEYADGGAIAVSANIAGATVTIAGLKAGATPLLPRPIGLGRVEVTADKPGWRSTRAEATILPGVVTDVILTLDEAPTAVEVAADPGVPTVGWLRLDVAPDAAVTVDGAAALLDERGRYTLAPGPHVVEVRSPGLVPYRATVRVERGQERTVRPPRIALGAAAARERRATIAFAAAGGLAVTGAVLAWFSLDAADQARDWAAVERARPTSVPLAETTAYAPLRTRAEIEARGDTARGLAWASAGAYLAAAAVGGLAIYWRTRGDERSAIEIAPTLGDGWGVSVAGALP